MPQNTPAGSHSEARISTYLLGKHHETLLVLITDLRSLSDANRELIEGGLAAIGDALAQTRAPSAGTYGAIGRHSDGTHRAVTLDGAL